VRLAKETLLEEMLSISTIETQNEGKWEYTFTQWAESHKRLFRSRQKENKGTGKIKSMTGESDSGDVLERTTGRGRKEKKPGKREVSLTPDEQTSR